MVARDAAGKMEGAGGAAGPDDAGVETAAGDVAPAARPAKPRRPRSKAAGAAKAMAKAEALGAAGTAAMAELAGLQRQVGQLGQGLTVMLDAQETHTELLRAILKATTADTKPEANLAELLARVAVQLGKQHHALREVAGLMAGLPASIGREVGEQVRSALATVR